ncbi:MAG: NAD(P)H-hydrate dehydratase [Gammaproteobacteria bacterium]|jgi:NAD(P)H-hydrate epimerase|nr:NAD(P)H-hydrate dehydratase [Gammaproteobacteria bacterium]
MDTPITLHWQALQQKLPKRAPSSHKGDYGHVLVIGGAPGYSGAARLAAESALRVGAGLVSVATHSDHAHVLNIGRPELMCHAVETEKALLSLIEKASVILIGPGLGQDAWGRTLFNTTLQTDKPLVIDADGLNLLAKLPKRKHHWILTPHPGEAARLLNHLNTHDIQNNRLAAVKALQADYGGVIVLKGAQTLIANAQNVFLNKMSNPAMASGGMGDVLAGMVAGLLAQHIPALDAANIAVMTHSLAAEKFNVSRGVLASDLWQHFPELLTF